MTISMVNWERTKPRMVLVDRDISDETVMGNIYRLRESSLTAGEKI